MIAANSGKTDPVLHFKNLYTPFTDFHRQLLLEENILIFHYMINVSRHWLYELQQKNRPENWDVSGLCNE
jgi:hypothetical protein